MTVKAWTREQTEEVVDLLKHLVKRNEVAAYMDVDDEDMDVLSQKAFGAPFDEVQAKYHAAGRAKLKKELYDAAMEGNTKAMDLLARTELDMAPVKSFTAKEAKKTTTLFADE